MDQLLAVVVTEPAVLLAIALIALVLVVCIVMGRRIEAKVGMVHFELNPNGGKTVRDSIDRIERRLVRVELKLKALKDQSSNE